MREALLLTHTTQEDENVTGDNAVDSSRSVGDTPMIEDDTAMLFTFIDSATSR